jgi:hypothetical protein
MSAYVTPLSESTKEQHVDEVLRQKERADAQNPAAYYYDLIEELYRHANNASCETSLYRRAADAMAAMESLCRCNVAWTPYGVMICSGGHDSSDECDWRHYYNADDYLEAVQRADAAEARIAALETALKTYVCDCREGCCEVGTSDDTLCGHRARAALAQGDK